MLSRRIGLISLIAAACGAGMISAQAADDGMQAFAGTWERSLDRSSSRSYTQTVTISHANGLERFATDIVTDGKRSGYRYEARHDGKPYDLFDVVTGKKRGTVIIDTSRPRVIALAFKDDGAAKPFLLFERWLSSDGRSYVSLVKNQDGAVTSASIFEKVK